MGRQARSRITKALICEAYSKRRHCKREKRAVGESEIENNIRRQANYSHGVIVLGFNLKVRRVMSFLELFFSRPSNTFFSVSGVQYIFSFSFDLVIAV